MGTKSASLNFDTRRGDSACPRVARAGRPQARTHSAWPAGRTEPHGPRSDNDSECVPVKSPARGDPALGTDGSANTRLCPPPSASHVPGLAYEPATQADVIATRRRTSDVSPAAAASKTRLPALGRRLLRKQRSAARGRLS